MASLNQIFRCNVCGHIIEILHEGTGELVCCEQPMALLVEKTEDKGQEKHVPVVEKTEEGIKVKVGEIPHPMETAHYIEWIEIIIDGENCRKFLKPGETPEADFPVTGKIEKIREYCNLHGLWIAIQ